MFPGVASWIQQDSGDLPKTIVHGDLWPDNCLGDDRQITALLDWEECGIYPAIIDVAMTIVAWSLLRDDGLPVEEIVSMYSAVRPLGVEEKNALPSVLVYSLLMLGLWRYVEHHVRHPDPTRVHRHKEVFNALREYLAHPL